MFNDEEIVSQLYADFRRKYTIQSFNDHYDKHSARTHYPRSSPTDQLKLISFRTYASNSAKLPSQSRI